MGLILGGSFSLSCYLTIIMTVTMIKIIMLQHSFEATMYGK